MLLRDFLIIMGTGGLFVLIGLAMFIWGKVEKGGYYDSLTTHTDVSEDLESPEPASLKIGGWIAIAIGLLMLIIGGIFWLLG